MSVTVRVVGIGTDLAHVPRFRRFLEPGKGGVLDRLFTVAELEESLQRRDPAPHLAARFAAKEAFLKALGTGLRDGLSWQQLEVRKDQLGKPSLSLSGRAEEVFAERRLMAVHLSYSHDGEYATATVVLEGECAC